MVEVKFARLHVEILEAPRFGWEGAVVSSKQATLGVVGVQTDLQYVAGVVKLCQFLVPFERLLPGHRWVVGVEAGVLDHTLVVVQPATDKALDGRNAVLLALVASDHPVALDELLRADDVAGGHHVVDGHHLSARDIVVIVVARSDVRGRARGDVGQKDLVGIHRPLDLDLVGCHGLLERLLKLGHTVPVLRPEHPVLDGNALFLG